VKTVTLRTLVRQPTKVKRLPRAGSPVQVTDNGEPLWIIHPASDSRTKAERIAAVDAILDETLAESISSFSAAKTMLDSRG
jgi:hypothetical protein